MANPDPGLSPLGTDDEAAGRPASPRIIEATRREEAAIGASAQAEVDCTRTERAWVIPALLAALLVFLVAVAAYGLIPR